jgi:SAM-dependent methyltransferase
MNPAVRRVFAQILEREAVRGPVLEVGAVPGPDALLSLDALAGIGPRIGLNLQAFPATASVHASAPFEMVQGNANAMTMFADASFGCVLSNATLEHDGRFWQTLAEIRRVTAAGGLVVIGVPGFRGMGPAALAPPRSLAGRGISLLARLTRHEALLAGSGTLGEHHFPGDYYRFSEQAMREILLQDLLQPQCRWVMSPPRIVGWARKP